jgi:tRNA threonylcarbamoyladenosine biosynthesis protein TsaE
MFEKVTHTPEETSEVGFNLGKQLSKGCVVVFYGDLAAGKTTFIKGLIAGVSGYAEDDVCSPTFVYMNIYEGDNTVYHFDLYRLSCADEFLSLGFDEYFEQGICCIEWAERIEEILPSNKIAVTINHQKDESRHITVSSWDL